MKKVFSLMLAFIMLAVSVFHTLPALALGSELRFGIDISEHNGDFDIASKKENGNSFVMIRLGYSDKYLDKQFIKNIENAAEAEIDFGVYLYSYAFDSNEAKQEADFVLKTLASLPEEYLEHMTLPVAYDLEEKKILENCDKEQITTNMTVFCDTIRSGGYAPMVYSNTNWFENYINIDTAVSKGYKLWYAYYPDTDIDLSRQIEIGSTGYTADMWQYSTTSGALDLNVMYPSLSCTKHSYKSSTTKATLTKAGSVTTRCTLCGAVKPKVTIAYPKTIRLSQTELVYNGKIRKPTVTVKDSKGKTISSKNYTVTYDSGLKKVGKYKVTIKFKGNYSGTKKLCFTIAPKATTLSSVTASTKGFTVKWKKQATETTGYQLQYSTSKSFKNAKTVTINKNTTTSKKIGKLSANKKYYVKVRTYKVVGKTKYYSDWSGVKTVTTKK